MRDRPRLLDLFCKAGGCTKGYQLAGFHVTGVDIDPQPRYCGDTFVQADALEYVARHGHEFDAISASPPCQGYSRMRHVTGKEYPLMIPMVRSALRKTGRPYIIENVEDAPLIDDILLCGTMFGLKTFRHRKFETSFFYDGAAPHYAHPIRQSIWPRPAGHRRTPVHYSDRQLQRYRCRQAGYGHYLDE